MANKTQYKKSVKSEMFRHYERAKKANGEYYQFENELIDASRSYLNYNLAKDLQPLGQEEYFSKATEEELALS